MKRLITLCLIAAGLVTSQVSVKAQATGPETSSPIPPVPRGSFPEIERVPTSSARSRYPPTREDKVIQKGILAPAASDVAQHQFLLSQKNTGMMRLLPRLSVHKAHKDAGMRGGGAYFSFHYRSHQYGFGSDVSYEQGRLKVGFAGADYGMLTDLGNTPLEPISAEDTRVGFLLNYKAPRKLSDARLEAKKFGMSGFTVDGVPYRSRVDAVVNHTYLLRSINYRTSDVLVAFRIVSGGADGGITIAWKILKEYRPTELIPD
jgi:hypothetical protein